MAGKPRGKPFQQGNKAAEGRGANKITRTVREGFLETFNKLQEDDKTDLLSFAKKYPRDFYALASKLIPTEIAGNVDAAMTIKIVRDDN